jgi:topoisomerase-4 subunit A
MAKTVAPPPPPPAAPIDVPLREALEERYLAYALSTIMGRALPDARDGLKPVHRRILYGMHILKLDPGSAFKKCAKIVGDVMGSFHPHGDQAIYEALVRLAQDFASRYPLIDGQGNFGNIDGDGAAAYRYTEARMTDVARLLLEGVDEEAVDWRDNYSGDAKEPIVLPSAIPNLLANGAQGIAVGMATSIPPHNVAELCDAALYLIAHPKAEVEALLGFAPGPDFPTGGIVVDDPASIAETYRTGRGGFPLARALDARGDRARRLGRGRHRDPLRRAEIAPDRAARDAADRAQGAAARRRPRRVGRRRARRARAAQPHDRTGDDDGAAVQAQRARDAHSGQPQRAGRRRDAARRQFRRSAAAMARPPPRRAHAPLRPSARGDRAPARAGGRDDRRLPQPRRGHPHHPRGRRAEDGADGALQAHRDQANYILDTRLRSLRRLEEMALRKEQKALKEEKGAIEALLANEKKQWQAVAYEIRDVKKKFGPDTKLGKRRTTFEIPTEIEVELAEALIEREPVTSWFRKRAGSAR